MTGLRFFWNTTQSADSLPEGSEVPSSTDINITTGAERLQSDFGGKTICINIQHFNLPERKKNQVHRFWNDEYDPGLCTQQR